MSSKSVPFCPIIWIQYGGDPWGSIDRAPGQDADVWRGEGCPAAVCVAAEHGDPLFGIALRDFPNGFLSGHVGKMREVFRIRIGTLVPGGALEWGDVGCDPNVIILRQRFGKDFTKVIR